ncbi:MAG TPA: G1 family glutamic endopeptidase [Acidimicrobiales bacterium]|nr:G1 family glutamic endopeptidase [Acidimicrobiales bacterium]
MLRRRSLLVLPFAGCLALGAAPGTAASPAHAAAARAGGLIKVAQSKQASPSGNQSMNWFGYNIGSLERSGTTFHSISARWVVPTASQHTKGQAESSSTWIGIGGGCVDSGCLVGDNTLIQAGTEQDVSASGARSYSAWWEIIPGPSFTISGMKVAAGDQMSVNIAEARPNSEIWNITVKDLTRGETFTNQVPYSSSYDTAEWIDETPLVIDTSGAALADLPNLTTTHFDSATVNGADPHLVAAEKISLIDGNGKVIGAPSAPDAEGDGFSDCAWHSTC